MILLVKARHLGWIYTKRISFKDFHERPKLYIYIIIYWYSLHVKRVVILYAEYEI